MKRLIDILDEGTRRGVADLYDLLQEDAAFLHEASVADKVIGKAAASLMVLGKVKEVSVHTISQPALQILQEAGIPVRYDEVVHHIINRDHTGWCPLEQASRDLHSVQEIYPVIQSFITRQRKQG